MTTTIAIVAVVSLSLGLLGRRVKKRRAKLPQPGIPQQTRNEASAPPPSTESADAAAVGGTAVSFDELMPKVVRASQILFPMFFLPWDEKRKVLEEKADELLLDEVVYTTAVLFILKASEEKNGTAPQWLKEVLFFHKELLDECKRQGVAAAFSDPLLWAQSEALRSSPTVRGER